MEINSLLGKTLSWKGDYYNDTGSFVLTLDNCEIARFIRDSVKQVKEKKPHLLFYSADTELVFNNHKFYFNKKYYFKRKGLYEIHDHLEDSSMQENGHLVEFIHPNMIGDRGNFRCRCGNEYEFQPTKKFHGLFLVSPTVIYDKTGAELFRTVLKKKFIAVSPNIVRYDSEEMFQVLMLCWINLAVQDWLNHQQYSVVT